MAEDNASAFFRVQGSFFKSVCSRWGSLIIVFGESMSAFNKWMRPWKTVFQKTPREIHLTSPRTQDKSLSLILLSDVHSPDSFLINEVDHREFDLVLTLGDINEATMDYILNQARLVPVYGVYGNHDPETVAGLDSLDDNVLLINGYRIGGISGKEFVRVGD